MEPNKVIQMKLFTKTETDSQMNGQRRGGVYIHNGGLLSHKKNEVMSSATRWTDLEMIKLRKRKT